jgi:hypothetical protein
MKHSSYATHMLCARWHAIEPSIPLHIVRSNRPGTGDLLKSRSPICYDMFGRRPNIGLNILLDLLSVENVESLYCEKSTSLWNDLVSSVVEVCQSCSPDEKQDPFELEIYARLSYTMKKCPRQSRWAFGK